LLNPAQDFNVLIDIDNITYLPLHTVDNNNVNAGIQLLVDPSQDRPIPKKLLRWVMDTGSGSTPGEIMPNKESDLEGYITRKETYLSVEATLHTCLGGMLPVVLADLRYLGLGEECRILERVRVIREIYADYDLVCSFILCVWRG
jgi:hypothetical protein